MRCSSMYNQSKLHLKDSIAMLNTRVFVVKQTSILFFLNASTHKNNNLYGEM
jgi:hypothetical protein